MKIVTGICALLFTFAVGNGVGYYLRGCYEDTLYTLPTTLPSLDYFVYEQSFSEVQNARATLKALAVRYVTEIRLRRVMDNQSKASQVEATQTVSHEPNIMKSIHELERGWQEFRGTEEGLILAQDLLRALNNARCYDQWLNCYLTILSEHPTSALVATHAKDALQISRILRQERSIRQVLVHLSNQPLEFPTKATIRSTLEAFNLKAPMVQPINTPTMESEVL